jgi:hypothetical protein
MSNITTNTQANYLPATYNFSTDYNSFLRDLNILYRKIAQAVSDREIGRYDCLDQGTVAVPGFERVSGQQWSSTSNQKTRAGFRKVVLFPALSAGTNSQPHNLGAITTYQFTRIDGVLQNPSGSQFVPVPQGDPNDAYVDVLSTNVRIILPGSSPWVGFTAVVVLEYLKTLT